MPYDHLLDKEETHQQRHDNQERHQLLPNALCLEQITANQIQDESS